MTVHQGGVFPDPSLRPLTEEEWILQNVRDWTRDYGEITVRLTFHQGAVVEMTKLDGEEKRRR